MTIKPIPSYRLSKAEEAHLVDAFVGRVGARLQAIRKGQDLSTRDVAKLHNFRHSFITRVERGQSNLTARTAVRVAYAVNVRPFELFMLEAEHIPKPKRRWRSAPSDEALGKAVESFLKAIGERISSLRRMQGMSLLTLQNLTGLATALQRFEDGEVNIRASTAIRLADAIGVQPHELYLPSEQSGIRLKS